MTTKKATTAPEATADEPAAQTNEAPDTEAQALADNQAAQAEAQAEYEAELAERAAVAAAKQAAIDACKHQLTTLAIESQGNVSTLIKGFNVPRLGVLTVAVVLVEDERMPGGVVIATGAPTFIPAAEIKDGELIPDRKAMR